MSRIYGKVKIAGIQMSCKPASKDENVRKALNLIDAASKEDAKIILLPELFSTDYSGYCRRNLDVFEYAESIPGPTTEKIAKKARQHSVYIIAPIHEKTGPGIYYNTAAVIDTSGKIMGKYRKTHIPATMSLEKLYFRPGLQYPVFKTSFGTIGILICYDRVFPENWRILTLKGAEIVFVPAGTGLGLVPWGSEIGWEPLIRTRAYENGVFVAAVNRVGKEEGREFFGNSMIVSPRGDIVARAGQQEAIISATVDLGEIDKARIEKPILRDLRPEIYLTHLPYRKWVHG